MKFYRCNKCGKILTILDNSEVPTICCGEEMKELKPLMLDETLEDRHVPVMRRWGNKVCIKIGSDVHPSNVRHHIEFIAIEYDNGFIMRYIKTDECPIIKFKLCKALKVKAIYCHCNLHGLWVKEMK